MSIKLLLALLALLVCFVSAQIGTTICQNVVDNTDSLAEQCSSCLKNNGAPSSTNYGTSLTQSCIFCKPDDGSWGYCTDPNFGCYSTSDYTDIHVNSDCPTSSGSVAAGIGITITVLSIMGVVLWMYRLGHLAKILQRFGGGGGSMVSGGMGLTSLGESCPRGTDPFVYEQEQKKLRAQQQDQASRQAKDDIVHAQEIAAKNRLDEANRKLTAATSGALPPCPRGTDPFIWETQQKKLREQNLAQAHANVAQAQADVARERDALEKAKNAAPVFPSAPPSYPTAGPGYPSTPTPPGYPPASTALPTFGAAPAYPTAAPAYPTAAPAYPGDHDNNTLE